MSSALLDEAETKKKKTADYAVSDNTGFLVKVTTQVFFWH